MKPPLSPAQQRHLRRYAQGDTAYKNTPSEQRLLALGFLERCDTTVRYNDIVTWTIYKARITERGRQYWQEINGMPQADRAGGAAG
jgi:hypothetical protein